MKQGTLYAVRLKEAYAKFSETLPVPEMPEPDEPLRRLAIGILGVSSHETDAEEAVDRIMATMIDWNEVRVSRPFEIQKVAGDAVPDGLRRIQRLTEALQSLFDRENGFSLEKLKTMGRRDARQYLDELDGVDEYAAASVMLWSLGGHAIPVNDRLLEALRDEDLVHPSATRAEVQAFLERHVSATQGKEFCVNMRSFPGTQSRAKGEETTA